MKKISIFKQLVVLSLFVIVNALIFSKGAYAQQATPPLIAAPVCENTMWVCPSMTNLGLDVNGNPTIRLSASNLPATDPQNNLPIDWYVVCGYDDPEMGMAFSSDMPDVDEKLCLGSDTHERMTRIVQIGGYEIPNWNMTLLNGTTNPQTTSDGTINATVRLSTIRPQNHTCFFVAQTTPEVVGRDSDTNVNAGSRDTDSLVYATFRTEAEPAACMSVRADPFGRVFNDKLKPVPGAVVNIFDFASKAPIKMAGVPNPVTTKEDGTFNFNIEPGISFLTTNLTNVDVATVHPNAALAYSNLYKYGDPIEETLNKPEQRDIPVTGGMMPVLKLMGFSHLQLGEKTRIEGRASWPLTQVDILQGDISIAQQNADKFGGFSFFIENSTLDSSQQITLRLTEVDMLSATPVAATNPKKLERTFDPIPRYIEGYAYNKAGSPMPFATVRVVIDNSDVVYYETKADANAFFSIGPRFLPILPFHLEYSPANVLPAPANTIKVTIPDFVKKNKQYLDANIIDPMRGTKKGVAVDPNAFLKNAKKKISNENVNNGVNNPTSQKGNNFNNTPGNFDYASPLGSIASATGQSPTVVLAILIILFIIVAAILIVYIRKQRMYTMSHKRKNENFEDEEPEAVA